MIGTSVLSGLEQFTITSMTKTQVLHLAKDDFDREIGSLVGAAVKARHRAAMKAIRDSRRMRSTFLEI